MAAFGCEKHVKLSFGEKVKIVVNAVSFVGVRDSALL
jgi:hypothetical protein